jgi:hypothetical protein
MSKTTMNCATTSRARTDHGRRGEGEDTDTGAPDVAFTSM